MRRYKDPLDLQAERAVLGAMVTSHTCAEEALAELTELDFYLETHRAVFRECQNLISHNLEINHIAVASKLGEKGRALVHSLVDAVPIYAGMPQWIASLKEHSMRRGVMARSERVLEAAIERDPAVELEELHSFASDTSEGEGVQTFAQFKQDFFERVMLRKAGESVMGIPTGLSNLDRATTGWHDGDLIVVAARPRVGKSVYTHQAAVTAARHGFSVFWMNLEMDFKRIQERLACAVSGVSYENWRRGKINARDAERLMAGYEELSRLPIKIHNPKSGCSITDCRRAVRALKPDIVFVDYLQLLRPPEGFRGELYHSVTIVSNDLKQLALSEQVPVVCTAQLNRSVEDRYDKRPILADLRESGYIEQDADVVVMLYRDDIYYPEGVRDGRNGPETVKNFHPQKIEFVARKDREGGNWMVPAYFEGEAMWLSEEPYQRSATA